MCGILGFYDETSTDDQSIKNLNSGLSAIQHRGPDGAEFYRLGPVGLGHRRLSIIDLASGMQPMQSYDKRYVIVFNGEIYNYRELREELLSLNCQFKTNSDTEVLLNGYSIWKQDLLQKIEGMFSFLIFDQLEMSFFAARDPYGQKPFFYFWDTERFYFGSEVRVFKTWENLKISIDLKAITHFLAFESFYSDRTVYQKIRKLKPGHFLFLKKKKITIQSYYESIPSDQKVSKSESVEHLDNLLKNSIKGTFESDVPVALLLSGGLDSSLVCAYARELFQEKEIKAFHIANTTKTFNESTYAKKVAKHCSIQLEIIDLNLDLLSELAKTLPSEFDEPMADPGILPKYLISKEIRKTFKVAITGDGGDEFFYGYLIMKAEKLAQIYKYFPDWMQKNLIPFFIGLIPNSTGYMNLHFLLRNFLKGFPSEDALRSIKWMNSFSNEDLKKLLINFEDSDLSENTQEIIDLYELPKKSSYLGKFAYRLQKTYLPDYILANSDRASMLNSLELRTPLLDKKLTQYLNSLDDNFKMPGMNLKYLMKKIAGKKLPKDVIYRKKMGFTVPIAELLKTTLKNDFQETFSKYKIKSQGIFHFERIEKLWNCHQSGAENLYKPLWTLYSLQKWLGKNL